MAYGSLASLALYCPVQSGSRILRDGHMAQAISYMPYASSFHLRPGTAVILKGVNFQPTFVDLHAGHLAAAIDDLLQHIGEGGSFQGFGFMEAPALVVLAGLVVDGAQEVCSLLGKHGQPHKLAIRFIGRQLLAEAGQGGAFRGWQEAIPGLRWLVGDNEVRFLRAHLLQRMRLVAPGPIHDDTNVSL